VLTSRRIVSAVLSQYLSGVNGLNSKSWAVAAISLTLIGFAICDDDDPAIIVVTLASL
jgi:hypothetical protein